MPSESKLLSEGIFLSLHSTILRPGYLDQFAQPVCRYKGMIGDFHFIDTEMVQTT